MPPSQVYRGFVRKLVVGIDVGTTFSGVSYAILDPGEVPSIHSITRCAQLTGCESFCGR